MRPLVPGSLHRKYSLQKNRNNRVRRGQLSRTGLVLIAVINIAFAAPHQSLHSAHALDQQFLAVINAVLRADTSQARALAKGMVRRFPDFTLGHLILAEIESSQAFGNLLLKQDQGLNNELLHLLYEAKVRLEQSAPSLVTHNQASQARAQSWPDSLIQRGNSYEHLIVVDLNKSLLMVLSAHHELTLLDQHYIGQGKAGFGKSVEGDNKTPVGIYRVVDKISDAKLPTLYGTGALTLDYPNTLDRLYGRTGYGIWLHGVPHHQMSRSPLSSEGCITMSNDHLNKLFRRIVPDSTLVLLGDHISNTPPDKATVKLFRELFEQYRLNKTENALQTSGDQKSVIKAFSRISLDQLTILRHPSLKGHLALDQNDAVVQIRTRFGEKNEYTVVLDWALQTDGSWNLIAEEWLQAINNHSVL